MNVGLLSEGIDSNINLRARSRIQTFKHSGIQTFGDSNIQGFKHSNIETFKHFQEWSHSMANKKEASGISVGRCAG